MLASSRSSLPWLAAVFLQTACSPPDPVTESAKPRRVVDLGAVVTPDLPEQFLGRRFLEANGFDRPNTIEPLPWSMERWDGQVDGRNAYVSVFNHGGPHVDAPNHVGLPGGLEAFPVDAYVGPLKVFDVRGYPLGRSVPVEVFENLVAPGDVVLLLTGYRPPSPDELPEAVTLTWEAAEYLANLPVGALGSDAFSVGSSEHPGDITEESPIAKAMPVHWSFLSRGIPVYEQLTRLDALLGEDSMYFVGVPLNLEGSDGMIVRPVALVY